MNQGGDQLDFLKTVEVEIKKSERQCKANISNHIDTYFRILEKKISELIEEGNSDKVKVQRILKQTLNNLEQSISKTYRISKKNSITRIESRLNQLERYSSLSLGSGVSSVGQLNNFELGGLDELEISMNDIADFGLAFTGFLFGPWGGLIL